ncbi:MAG TPA: hypothetical protein PKK06_05060 [Phycisphaerae bacterium]|nr:hypothetical protein [Phycisphaerae bacterium]
MPQRDEKGRFISEANAGKRIAELNAQLQKQAELIQKIQVRQARAPKLDKTIARGMKAQVKLLREQTKAAAGALKSYEKMQKQTAKIQQRLIKSRQQAAKALPGHAGGRESKAGGVGLNLPTFVSAAVIVAATKAMIGYVTELARARDYARALGGNLKELPYRRDQELYSKYAQQNFANRFSSPQEIAGLKNLRDSMTTALGPELGESITLKLTEALKGSTAELQRFLVLASQNVPRALAQFESADIETFATALKAATMETDEWSKAASNLENLWIDIQQIGEQLAGIIAPVFGDIAAKLRDSTKEGSAFRTTIIDAAEGGVLGLYNLIAWIKEGYSEVLGWKQLWQEVKVAILDVGTLGGTWGKETYDAAVKELEETAVKAHEIRLGLAKSNKQARDLEGYFKQLRERAAQIPTDQTAQNLEQAAQAAQKARQELERAATPAERAALAVQKLAENLEIADAELKVVQSALRAAESSPFGFGEAFEKRLELVAKINERIDILREQLAEINAIENQTRADRMKALEIESQINDAIADRNQLLQQQQRGYLDAVQAQAFAAGRFEKIITSQEANVAMALTKGIAKKNPYIGQVGKDAERYAVQPFRFGTNMEANIQGLNEYSKALRANVADPIVEELQRLNRNLIVPQTPQERDARLGEAAQSSVRHGKSKSAPARARSIGGNGIAEMKDAARLLVNGLDKLEDHLSQIEIPDDPSRGHHQGVRGGSVLPSSN